MRIALAAATDPRTDRRVRAHARALGAAGHQVTLFGVAAPGTEPEEDDGPVVIVRVPLPAGNGARAAASPWGASPWARRHERVVQAAVARGHFDVLHACGVDIARAALRARRPGGACLVLDDAGPGRLDLVARRTAELPVGARRAAAEVVVAYLRRGEDRAQRRARATADLVVAASPALATDGLARWGGPPPVVVHDSFVAPPRRTGERLRARLGIHPDERVIVVREEGRGAESVARALRILGDRHVLVLAGWCGSPAAVLAAAEATDLAGRVRLLPPAPEAELLEFCAGADVGVLLVPAPDRPGRLAAPRGFYELLAAGTPVVAPDTPGTGELVRATGAGVLYPGRDPADPGAVAEALRTVLSDPSLAAACRERALRARDDDLSWTRQAARLTAAYEMLAATV